MKLNALKVLFYTFILHAIIPDIQSDDLTTFGINSDSSTFIKLVEEFQKKYNLVDGAEFIYYSQDDKFGKVSKEFIKFEINLLLILQQMVYVFDERNDTTLIHADYFITICTYLPRCLDFINVNVIQDSITIMLSNIYVVLCYSLPTYLKTYINALPNHIESERFNEKIANDLSNILSITKEKTKIRKNLFHQKNYKMDSQNFITDVYKIIGNIDFISCMSKNLDNISQYYMAHNSNTKEIKFKGTKVSTRDKEKQINSGNNIQFLQLNRNYTNDLRNECGLSSFDIQSKDLSKLETMQEIVFYTLKKLQQYCTNTILNSTKTNSIATENDLKNTIDIMDTLRDICQNMSSILVFFIENEVNDDSITFSTYLPFCGDFKGYSDIRCTSAFHGTSSIKDLKDQKINCIQETLKNIWTWNILMTTTEVPQKNEDKNLKNVKCKFLYLNYLVNINNTIRKLYKGMDVWTTFEWLSGKYFLAENIENDRMYEIKSNYIDIKNVNIKLSVAYYAALPWGLNMSSIGTFHNVIVNNVEQFMNAYVYIYALIVHVIQKVRDSVRWYNEGTKLFYKYLHLPLFIVKDPQNESLSNDNIKTIIYRIQNIDDNGYLNINDIIPDYEKNYFLIWADSNIPNNDDGNNQFNKLLNGNCMGAMDYMSTFLSIVQKSMDINSEFHSATSMYSQYCPENIFDVISTKKPMTVVRDKMGNTKSYVKTKSVNEDKQINKEDDEKTMSEDEDEQISTETGSESVKVIGSSSPETTSTFKTVLMSFLKFW
ncbi:Hypothetical protein CINCED_3A014334 [Cinara cedri]|uniref:Uncharacterized protein n=1 Tax=Cinara cedri TaxID=506608 RepID=A0A5E4NT23_9HEMI|nr:Hypothetical protein CINCED_3A014334 [Cinara cedri]